MKALEQVQAAILEWADTGRPERWFVEGVLRDAARHTLDDKEKAALLAAAHLLRDAAKHRVAAWANEAGE